MGYKLSNFVFAYAVVSFAFAATAVAVDESVSFDRHIRRILSDKCFVCHGPDASRREADLRLDVEEVAKQSAIVPGDVEASPLHERIHADDPDVRMPPPDSKLSLTNDEKILLDRWIAEGATYDSHWSFQPPERPALPDVSQKSGGAIRNGIDNFIISQLEQEGLSPSPEASRETLIRRVTLDATGLPPTPAEVEAFLNDESESAYERVVDRLLDSPHYGERMALVWLDAARYADSAGYQNDFRRSQWPWRDWVIEAYNRNMPFDQFTIEQLAGDLLENPTDKQRLATAFCRNHRINNEGGIIPEEWLVEYVADRVETMSTVWLGMTVGCARCHDHKYDPIPQREFYSLFAFFNNVPEKGKDGSLAPEPSMSVYTAGTRSQHEQLITRLSSLKDRRKELKRDKIKAFESWIEGNSDRIAAQKDSGEDFPLPVLHAPLDFAENRRFADTRQPRRNIAAVGRGNTVKILPNSGVGGGVQFAQGGYLRIANPHPKRKFRSDQPASWAIHLKARNDIGNVEGPIIGASAEDKSERGYRIVLEDDDPAKPFRVSFRLFSDRRNQDGVEVVSQPAISRQDAAHLAVTYDGSGSATGVRIFVDGQEVATTTEIDQLQEVVTIDSSVLVGASSEKGARDNLRDASFTGGVVDDIQIYAKVLSPQHVAQVAGESPVDAMFRDHERPSVREYLENVYFSSVDEDYQGLLRKIKAAETKLAVFERDSLTEVSIMREMEQPRETYLLNRGAYDQPDRSEQLSPETFSALPSMRDDFPKNRLGLARWLFQPDHPLTARVAVNRYWQMHFGRGLVETPEDFGSQGQRPTHPELLDWLAVHFRESGWDVKAMQKLIFMSGTYRQSSSSSPKLNRRDPENRLLARGPRFRLTGQALRDQALAVGGLLVPTIGGPPVMPYQPEGLWEEVSAKGYKYIVGEKDDLYRRSLYTFWRRTVPPPSMMNFDNASREVCMVTSARTNTPLQAMNLLNDPQLVEAARGLAERMILEGGKSPRDRVSYGHRLVLARDPEKAVRKILVAAYRRYLKMYREETEAADALISIGESQPDPSINSAELAAYTAIANTLLNLDETVTKE